MSTLHPDPLQLEPKKTALVLIDLQNGIVGMPTAPYSAAEVVKKASLLAQAFRAKGATVVYVRVDMRDFLRLPVDQPMRDPNAPPPSATASEISPQRRNHFIRFPHPRQTRENLLKGETVIICIAA